MLKKIITIFMLGILVVSMAACGANSQTTYQEIMDKKEMTFAMTGQYPPFNFINEDGDLTGFDIDIAKAIADKMGVKAVPITTAWDGIIAGLTGKRFDMIIGSMAVTEDRLKKVNFSDPYYYDGSQFFAKKGSGLNSIEDLKDGKVGVVTGTTFFDYLDENYSNIEPLQFKSDVDNMKAVEQGRSDGLVTAKLVGLFGAKKYNVAIEPVGKPFYEEKIAIALRKEDEKLLQEVNKALKEMKEDGTYDKLSKKWFGVNILEK